MSKEDQRPWEETFRRIRAIYRSEWLYPPKPNRGWGGRGLSPPYPPLPTSTRSRLAWDNGSIGALARSIREEGRVDTFGILADALEEAGCANEDLLWSCRQGDPDIDGAWVLAVLLGKEKRPG